MKKIFCALFLFLFVSCQKEENPSSIGLSEKPTISTTSQEEEISSSTKESKTSLMIHYIYEDGIFLTSEQYQMEVGKAYQIAITKEIPFMKRDIDMVKGIKKDAPETYVVTYSYDRIPVGKENLTSSFSPFMANEKMGISFSFLQEHGEKEILRGKDFCLTNQELQYQSQSIPFSLGYFETDYETSLTLKEGESAYFTYSFFPDKAVVYKNGRRILSLFNQQTNGKNTSYQDMILSIFSSIEQNGIESISTAIDEFHIDKGIDLKGAKEKAQNYIITELEVLDEENNLLEIQSRAKKNPYSYEFKNFSLPTYKNENQDILKGYAKESETLQCKLKYAGQKVALNKNSIDRTNLYGWSDEKYWLKYLDNIAGDFTIKVDLTNYGATSFNSEEAEGSSVCWRTLLPIVYDAEKKDLWVTRFDWYGWQVDGNQDNQMLGSYADYNHGESYVFDYNKDIYPIFQEMNVLITYQRIGSTLKASYRLKPKKGIYLGQEYRFTYTLYGIKANSLSFAIAAEDSKGIINEVYA